MDHRPGALERLERLSVVRQVSTEGSGLDVAARRREIGSGHLVAVLDQLVYHGPARLAARAGYAHPSWNRRRHCAPSNVRGYYNVRDYHSDGRSPRVVRSLSTRT